MCYSVDLSESLENIADKWYPEIKYHCPRTPIILVGKNFISFIMNTRV